MANRKLKVVGTLTVGGVRPGGTVELDDKVYNVNALIESGLCEEHVAAKSPAKESSKEASEGDFKSFNKGKGD